MGNWQAKRLCPDIVFIRPHITDYIQFSGFVREIYNEYTDRTESFGLDEALSGFYDNASYHKSQLIRNLSEKRMD